MVLDINSVSRYTIPMETLKESLETLWLTIADMRRVDLIVVAAMMVAEVSVLSTVGYLVWSKVL
jgi:hypothetical protein